MKGFTGERRSSLLWFELVLTDFFAPWKGKLIIKWPPPERSWWRRAHRNVEGRSPTHGYDPTR